MIILEVLEFTWDRTGSDPITQPNTNPLLLNKNKLELMELKLVI